MSSKGLKNRPKKPLETTLGKAVPPEKTEPDLSHIKKPIETSLFGLKQVLSLYKTATEEVQNYITYECEVMYECRICRTIFRSLANFILHKRNFCTEKYSHLYTNNYFESSKNEGTAPIVELNSRSATPSSPVLATPVKDNSNDESSTSDNSNNNSPLLEKGVQIVEDNIVLEKIDAIESAVFQSVHKTDEQLMKSQVMEIHGIFDNNEVVLDSDGKVRSLIDLEDGSSSRSRKLICSECNLEFSTKKTLTSHIKYKHTSTCTVYLCPDCNDTFANTWCVYRHLYKVHRRTLSQVRRLRTQIHSNIITRDQEQQHIQSKKVETKTGEDNIENQWMNNIESDKDFQMCGGCGKHFERKAALNSHSQMCAKRLAICNNIREPSKETTTKKEKKIKGAKKRKPKPSKVVLDEEPKVQGNKVEEPNLLDIDNLDAASVLKIIGVDRGIFKQTQEVEKNGDAFVLPVITNTFHVSDEEDDDCLIVENIDNNDHPETGTVEETNNKEQDQVVIRNFLLKRKRSASCDEYKPKTCKYDFNDDLFVARAAPFMHPRELKCEACEREFLTSYDLLWHMSLHFSWYRFECKSCSFMSFDKTVCETHARKMHSIPVDFLKHVVKQIEQWRSISVSHEFEYLQMESESDGDACRDSDQLEEDECDNWQPEMDSRKDMQLEIESKKDSQLETKTKKDSEVEIASQKDYFQSEIESQKDVRSKTSTPLNGFHPEIEPPEGSQTEAVAQKDFQPEMVNQQSFQLEMVSQRDLQPEISNQNDRHPETGHQNDFLAEAESQNELQSGIESEEDLQPEIESQADWQTEMGNQKDLNPKIESQGGLLQFETGSQTDLQPDMEIQNNLPSEIESPNKSQAEVEVENDLNLEIKSQNELQSEMEIRNELEPELKNQEDLELEAENLQEADIESEKDLESTGESNELKDWQSENEITAPDNLPTSSNGRKSRMSRQSLETVQPSKRSSRNRTKSVKIAQDDFIYDLKDVLKMNSKSVRSNSRSAKKIKPISK